MKIHNKFYNYIFKEKFFAINNNFLDIISKKYNNKMNVAEYIIERLKYEGVNTAFGYNGGAALPFFDSISKDKEFNLYFNRHEQHSGHCAQAYGKIKNNIGVVITTSGPGFTNVVTPLQDAYSDSHSLLCISSQVNSFVLGTDAFQECNAISISSSFVKNNNLVTNELHFPNRLEYMINLSKLPKKGPVHLDICKDVFSKNINFEDIYSNNNSHNSLKIKKKNNINNNLLFEAVFDKLNKSNKPVLIVGSGGIESYKKIRYMVKKYNIPVATTLHGLGVIDEYDKLSLKMLGMHGSYQANKAVMNADLIIGLGNRFDDRTVGVKENFGKNAKENHGIIHIDNCEKQIYKVHNYIESNMSINCDVEEFVDYMNKKNTENINYKKKNWLSNIKKWKGEFVLKESNNELSSNLIIKYLSEKLKDNEKYIITTGVGSHQMVVAQYFNHQYPNRLLTSGSLGTMGVGLPFAIGAQIANPGKKVILIDGDGSFTMSSNELATIREYELPIKILIMNDNKLKMVDLWQDLFYEKRKVGSNYNYTPEFHKLGQSYGIKSYVNDNINDTRKIIDEIIDTDESVLCNFKIDSSYCLPFVPPNKNLDDMVIEEII
jgi:acetolactate synthase I/II/III large subunit